MRSSAPSPRQARRVGLDKPCRLCGQAIYYNYRGPIEGICGKCVDKIRRSRPQNGSRRPVVVRRAGGRGRVIAAFLFGFALGAALALAAAPYLPF